MTPRAMRWMVANAAVLPVVFLGSIPIAYLVSPGWAQRSWIILAVLYPLVARWEKATQPSPVQIAKSVSTQDDDTA